MIRREILGLYLDKEQIHYACAKKSFVSLSPKRLSLTLKSSGIVYGPAFSVLKDLLKGFSPHKNRHIYLALPRSRFFARDLQLPPMTMEDALISVRSSLSIYCHLPLEEIYYDIHLCRTLQGGINALIFYALRKEIDPYLDIFKDMGHQNSLKGIFPVSFGVGAWLHLEGYPMPLGLILNHDEINELAVYGKKSCLLSMAWPFSEGEKEGEFLIETAKSKFQDLKDNIFYLNNEKSPVLPRPLRNRMGKLPNITENLGVAALSPVLSGWQQISIDGSPTKIKTIRPIKIIIPSVLAMVLIISFITWRTNRIILFQEKKVNSLKTEIRQLQKRLKPIEQKREALRKAKKFMEDIDDFIKTRPRLFSRINDVARLGPEGTWFSSFRFEKGVITMSGESKDALKVVESLRTSGLFEQVKLRGSVSRRKTGEERFSLTIKLREETK